MTKRCSICGININLTENEESVKCVTCNSINTDLSVIKKINPSRSIFYIFQGFSLIFSNSKLLKYSLIPICLTSIILFMVYSLGLYTFFSNFSAFIPEETNHSFWANLLKPIVGIFGTLIITAFIIFLFLPVSSLICIPFNDFLSMETEKLLLGYSNESEKKNIYAEIIMSIKEGLILLFFKLLLMILLFPINFIPLIGNISYLFFIGFITSIDFIDIIMARKKYSFKEKLSFIRNNFPSFLTFSFPLMALFWLPVIQIFIIPAATIGGTKFFLEAEKKGEIN